MADAIVVVTQRLLMKCGRTRVSLTRTHGLHSLENESFGESLSVARYLLNHSPVLNEL
jgi:hypothetical protein